MGRPPLSLITHSRSLSSGELLKKGVFFSESVWAHVPWAYVPMDIPVQPAAPSTLLHPPPQLWVGVSGLGLSELVPSGPQE